MVPVPALVVVVVLAPVRPRAPAPALALVPVKSALVSNSVEALSAKTLFFRNTTTGKQLAWRGIVSCLRESVTSSRSVPQTLARQERQRVSVLVSLSDLVSFYFPASDKETPKQRQQQPPTTLPGLLSLFLFLYQQTNQPPCYLSTQKDCSMHVRFTVCLYFTVLCLSRFQPTLQPNITCLASSSTSSSPSSSWSTFIVCYAIRR